MQIAKRPAVYILASQPNGTLYIGVTSNLWHRMAEHTQGLFGGFTAKYKVKHLVYYEMHETMEAAILRETQMKEWKRTWKLHVIEQMNPQWVDLYNAGTDEILDGPGDTIGFRNDPT